MTTTPDPARRADAGLPGNGGQFAPDQKPDATIPPLTTPTEPIDLISFSTKNVLVELEYIGEGLNGDYDESDPEDRPLLRCYVFKNLLDSYEDADWEQIDGASWCTRLGTDADRLTVSAWLGRAANIIEAHAQDPDKFERAARLVAEEAESLSAETVATAQPLAGDADLFLDMGQLIRDHMDEVPDGIEPEAYAALPGDKWVDEIAQRDGWNSTRWERFYDAREAIEDEG